MDPSSGTLHGYRILVVEDEALISLMIRDLLTASGGAVVGPAVSTKEALALLEQDVVHCAVLDVKLADGLSLPVANALIARGVPFVVATGYGETMDGYNGAPVIQKVFLGDDLVDAVAGLLRR